ncbi:MAG: lspA [Phycisphaerales bacterium]|nr:lspA [Phycisphaerales bacterium]
MIRSPFRSPSALACILLPLILGLGLDLLTKHIAFATLVTGTAPDAAGQIQVISRVAQPLPGVLHFQAHVNRGAVFGIAQNQRVVFVVVSFMALGLLAYLFARSENQRLYQVLLGVLFAGVLGNLYDRVAFGYVRDMIYILPNLDVFPWIFNIADSLLCTGVGGMFLYTFFRGEDPPARTRPEAIPA